MQFFHLVPFVVVASYAAALPQPAELSEKYLNNVNVNLASGLEARSYQPAFNSQKGSATLVSLKRRDDSEGSSAENSGSDSPPPPATTPGHTVSVPFTDDDVSTMNLAFTIDKVIDGAYTVFDGVERAGKKISGPVGDMMTMYLGKATYVNAALKRWAETSIPGIRDSIKSGLSDGKYSKVEPDLTKKFKEFEDNFRVGLDDITDDTSNIAENVVPVINNFQKIHRLFNDVLSSRVAIVGRLKFLLGTFTAGETLSEYLADISRSIGRFDTEKNRIYAEIMEEYEAASSQ
ncbi:hypothetical protein BASA83_012825 [Batrachochytrium salamandrivorans]|nr:hypothetical protein BASA83_012825 [Batrachochytrium salamandrivorans]